MSWSRPEYVQGLDTWGTFRASSSASGLQGTLQYTLVQVQHITKRENSDIEAGVDEYVVDQLRRNCQAIKNKGLDLR